MKIIRGKIIEGKKRGMDLGFPTANIVLKDKIEEGIYISILRIDKEKLPSLTFIGAALTFGEQQVKAETYILNFDKDIYNKEVTLELIEKIRDNKKFENKEDLIAEMENDKKIALEYFKEYV